LKEEALDRIEWRT